MNDPATKNVIKQIAPPLAKATGALAGLGTAVGTTLVTGNPALGAIAGNAVGGLSTIGLQKGVNKYTGSGVKRGKGLRSNIVVGGSFGSLGGSLRRGRGFSAPVTSIRNNVRLGGAIAAQSMVGITSTPGLEAMNSHVERMQKVRSFIGHNRLS